MASATAADAFRLHTAARTGKCNLIKQYLAGGDGVDSFDEKGRTPLTIAAGAGQVATVRLLLAEGANPSTYDKRGLSPLLIATELGSIVIAKMLLHAGADVSAVSTFGGVSGTPLHAAACKGDKKIVQLLIDAGCDVDPKLSDGDPPLVDATRKGHSSIVDMLIAAGADVNTRGLGGITALHVAVEKGNRALVARLLKYCAIVEMCDVQGKAALHRAAFGGFDEILNILLEEGADPNRKDDPDLVTPLHASALKGHHKCVWSLLCAKADVSAKDRKESTPLHYAARNDNTEVIELLLSAGAGLRSFDSDGRTPLVLACIGGHLKGVDLLLDAGADPNQLDANGRNSLFGAVTNLEVLKLLLSRGGSATFINNNRETPLHYGGYGGADAGVLCALFKAGVDPTLKNGGGKTAADVAREQGHEDAAKMIDLLIAKHQASA